MNDFSKNVYLAVQKIPRGKVTNYGCIAFMAGKPRAARGVGFVLHRNPDPVRTPCHRVVFKDGSLCAGYVFAGRPAPSPRGGGRRVSSGRPRRHGAVRLVRGRNALRRQQKTAVFRGCTRAQRFCHAYFLKLMLMSTGVLMPCTCALSEYCQSLKS